MERYSDRRGCTGIFVISDFCPKVDLFEVRLVGVN